MGHRRVSDDWNRAHRAFIERATTDFNRIAYSAAPPKNLFHFTDCVGLIEILKTKSLWASLATSLNDRSEMHHGMALIRELIDAGAVTARALPLDRLDSALARQSWWVFVISFCAQHDTALQWLHYGRSGRGVAVAFNSAAIENLPYQLCPVLYDKERQIDWVRSIVTTVDDALEAALGQIPNDGNRDLFVELAVELVATQIWMVTPRMKNPAFSEENEWRLVAYVPKGVGVPVSNDPAGSTYFRATAGRIVPYKKLVFDVLPVIEIVLGSSAPMLEDRLALKVLIEETLSNGDEVRVSVSTVPVRP